MLNAAHSERFTARNDRARRVPSASRSTRSRASWSTNAELKACDPAANPYLALGGLLAAGLDGVTRRLKPGEPTLIDPGNYSEAERATRGIQRYPTTLEQALEPARSDRNADGIRTAASRLSGPHAV